MNQFISIFLPKLMCALNLLYGKRCGQLSIMVNPINLNL